MEFAKMTSRKFSFDIPRLKIGPSKADTRAYRDQIAAPLDSPVEHPRSVRPPLPPILEAELRNACASVLQNFKPSHLVYRKQYGDDSHRQQLDYAAIKESAHREIDGSALLATVDTLSNDSAAVEEDSIRSGSVSSDRYKYKPDVPTQELFRKDDTGRHMAHKHAQSRAEELMAPVPAHSRTTAPPTDGRSESYSHSVSDQAHLPCALVNKDTSGRPDVAPRTDSMETIGSTPQTDSTDYPWSEKASTAMTSAVVTPARGSKRTSSQALQSNTEASSIPRLEPTNGDWMRYELVKHKKAVEARARQRECMNLCENATPIQTSTQTSTPARMQVPRRKPVPQRTQSRKESDYPRAESRQDSRPSADQTPTAFAHVRQPAETTNREDGQPERNGHCRSKAPDQPTSRFSERARSITRQVGHYVRPDTAQDDGLREGRSLRRSASRASSRAASVTRRVKDYIRPSTRASSRRPSVDEGSRAPSIDTSYTAFSDADSAVQPTNKWQTWRVFHRRGASRSSEGGDRPGTAGSTTDTRGRSTKSKPPVDLNRKLPPLPSLDQWQDASEQHQPAYLPASAQKERIECGRTPPSHAWQPNKQTSAGSESGDADHILASCMGPHKHLQSVDPRVSAQAKAPPLIPIVMSATMTGPADLSYDQYAPVMSEASILEASGPKKTRRRSRSVGIPEGYHGLDNDPSMYAALRSCAPENAQASESDHGTALSQRGQGLATTYHTSMGHSRNNSDRLVRKVSMDGYSRIYSRPSHTTAENCSHRWIQPSLLPHVKDKKWWRFKTKMDHHETVL